MMLEELVELAMRAELVDFRSLRADYVKPVERTINF